MGFVYTTSSQEEAILFHQKQLDRNRWCFAMLFKSIAVRGRPDSPDVQVALWNGAITFLAPFTCFTDSLFFVHFEANLCDEANFGLVVFSLVCRRFGCFGVLWLQNHLLSFSTPPLPFLLSKSTTFSKGHVQFWRGKDWGLVAQTLHHLCRAAAVAPPLVSHFSRYVFAVSHKNLAAPLKVSQKRPCRTLLGGVAP